MNYKLSRYIIPSVISMVLVGTYTNIDGFFIGNVMGDDGLAAINIVWPIVAFITSLGTGIGVGGSVILNNLRGQNDMYSAEEVKKTLLFLLFAIGLAASIIFTFLYTPLLLVMGAEGEVLKYSKDYALIICLGALFQIMGSGLVALLRNEQKTYFSMVCCVIGLIVHLLLDILLVEKYKISGVAVSTVLSQAVIMILSFFALKTDKNVKLNKNYILPILKGSTSPLGINFVPSVVLLFTNYFALAAGGTAGVSAYAVMSYAVYTFDYIYQGVCDGIQPIISFSCGAGDIKNEKYALKVSAIILLIFTAGFILLTPLLIKFMPRLFAVSDDAMHMMKSGFIIYAFSYPFKATVKFVCSYFYSIEKTKISNLLIYIDPVFFTPVTLLILSKAFGMNGVWGSLTASQILVALPGIIIFISFAIDKYKKSLFNNKN